MADVFLSYARVSVSDARRVAGCLRSAGYSVWFDETLPAHRAYSEVIEEQLDSAAAVVVLWSARRQIAMVRSAAIARAKAAASAAALDDARLPLPFEQIPCSDLSSWGGNCTLRPGKEGNSAH